MKKRLAAIVPSGSLARRLIVLLTLALLPIGLIAVFQTISVVEDASVLGERDILARTAQAANTEYSLIQRAYGAGYALGAMALGVGTDTEQCSKIMQRFVDDSIAFVFAGLIEKDGMLRCSSTGEGRSFADSEFWAGFSSDPQPTVSVSRRGAMSGESVVIATVPIYDASGAYMGGVSVSIPHSLSDTLLARSIDNVAIALVSGDGTVLSSSNGIDTSWELDAYGIKPATMPIGRSGTTQMITDPRTGKEELVAIVPLILDRLYVVGSWSERSQPNTVSIWGTATPIFPVLMWVASLFVAFFAVDRMVLRHLKALRGRMTGFSGEDPQASYAHLSGAPAELDEIAAAYNGMVDRIAAAHLELESSIQEKEILLKEIHHRVKNNLQLIASILNMQMRTIHSASARTVLRRIQDRVMGLATVHKSLYSDASADGVRADELLNEVFGGIINMALPTRTGLRTDCRIAPVHLDHDDAVPLSLLLTEAVTNAVKYARTADGGQPFVTAELTRSDDGMLTLTVANSYDEHAEFAEKDETSGLGSRLIDAFVSQLGAELTITREGGVYSLSAQFRHNLPTEPLLGAGVGT